MAAKRGKAKTSGKGQRAKASDDQQGGEKKPSKKRAGKKKPPGKQLQVGDVRTQKEVGKAFGVRVRTVRNWVADGMPRLDGGGYNLIEIQAWRDSRNGGTGTGPGIASEHQQAQTDVRKTRARKLALEVARMENLLVPRREVEKRMRAQSTALRRKLLGIPKSMAPLLVGMTVREIEATLKETVNDVLLGFQYEEAPEDLEPWPT